MEQWKPIKGYEGIYEVSDLGRVRSKDRWVRKNTVFKHSIILVQRKEKAGYMTINLTNVLCKIKIIRVHRLVATAFISNPENKPQVNHKNGIRDDNAVSNLEWCTMSENHLHSFRKLGRKPSLNSLGKFGKDNHRSIPVIKVSLSGEIINKYESLTEASKQNNISVSHLSVCRNTPRIAGGFRWVNENLKMR